MTCRKERGAAPLNGVEQPPASLVPQTITSHNSQSRVPSLLSAVVRRRSALAASLAACPTLTGLYLVNCALGPTAWDALFRALRSNTPLLLRRLSLISCDLGTAGARTVVEIVGGAGGGGSAIEDLTLGADEPMFPEQDWDGPLLAALRRAALRLKLLSFNTCGVGDAGEQQEAAAPSPLCLSPPLLLDRLRVSLPPLPLSSPQPPRRWLEPFATQLAPSRSFT